MFEQALSLILKHEGGYVNHPADPGGETNFGITKRVAVEHGYIGSMKAIPMSKVREIYRTSYWDRIKGDSLPWAVALVTFDAAVNSGVSRAAKWLQKALGTAQDGSMGPATIKALAVRHPEEVAEAMCEARLAFLKSLPTWPTFGKGWERRVHETLKHAKGA